MGQDDEQPKRGRGRPRELGEGDPERAKNMVVRLAQEHRDELAALVDDGRGATPSEALRWLIEESAKRRARRMRVQ